MPANEGAVGHLILVAASAVELALLAATLSDGSSLMLVKDAPPVIARCQGSGCANFTMREFTNWPYGIGAHHDMMGVTWGRHGYSPTYGGQNLKDTLATLSVQAPAGSFAAVSASVFTGLRAKMKEGISQFHIAAFFDCEDLSAVGVMLSTCCFAAVVIAFFQIVLSGVNLTLPGASLRGVHAFLQLTLAAAMVITLTANACIFALKWECDNRMIRTFKANDSFEWNYGSYFIVVVFVLAFAGVGVVFAALPSGGEPDEEHEGHEAIDEEEYDDEQAEGHGGEMNPAGKTEPMPLGDQQGEGGGGAAAKDSAPPPASE